MDVVDQQFLVTFRYPVHFARGVFAATNPLLRKVLTDKSHRRPTDFAVMVDDGVVRAHPGLLADIDAYAGTGGLQMTAPVLVLPGGEAVKNDPRHLQAIYERLHDAALCRQSYVVVVGGGAVLDAVGYAAATAHRGLRLIRVPTTVLAQDDSAMGVKNGVNAFGKKNYLGAFAPPFAVINDFDFLPTLLDRDWLSGVSEAIKAALIKDPDFFAHIEHQAGKLVGRDQAAMEDVIRHSAALHLSHIATAGDPFEQTSSRPLDFGHWAAHKLEQLSGHRLRHGEAVAIGIALDSTYS
jgi:3-dehydroquinate synthase